MSNNRIRTFTRDDGRVISVIDGFRERALSYRKRVTPESGWSDEEYARSVRKKLKRSERLIEQIARKYGPLENTEILEIGCGDGINTMLLGAHGAKRVVGIDIDVRLFKEGDKGESLRRLASEIIKALDVEMGLYQALAELPVQMITMDASKTKFADNSFDLAISRSVLEHIDPLDKLFSEIRRVVRPRGMIYHEIDPFFWLRGCHKRGLVDIPWAHARLTLEEYRRFVAATEDDYMAGKRLLRLTTLNRLTLKEWQDLIRKSSFELVEWAETPSEFAEDALKEYPEVLSTLLPGVERRDLVVGRVGIWLRNNK